MSGAAFFEARVEGLRIVHREDIAPDAVAAAIVQHRKNAAAGRDACEH